MALSIYCGLTSSIDYNACDKFAGGVVRIALGDYSSTTTPVWTYGTDNLITGATGAAVYYDIDQSSRIEFTNWTWTPDDAANRAAMGTLVATFFVYGMNANKIAKVSGINNSLFRAIVSDQNGKYFHIGTGAPALAKVTTAGSGVAGADLPGFELTLTVKTKDIIFEMDETTANTLIYG